ncbi:MAG: hypothetical protein ABIQ88_07315 [Chitinophagaceae bacterium]
MPVKKKKVAVKAKKAVPKKAAPAKKKSVVAKRGIPIPKFPLPAKKKYTVYIGQSAFFPQNSENGYIDLFQEGRCTAIPNRDLHTPIVVPVGATLNSISIHYINTTANPVLCLFLRLHADKFAPSGTVEMSFINMPPAILPPNNYPTVTDTTFADGNIIQDRYLHFLEIHGTGDFGAAGKITVRGVSFTYTY